MVWEPVLKEFAGEYNGYWGKEITKAMDLVKENLGADLNNGREKSEDTQNTLEAEITLPEVEVKEKLEGILKPAIIESKQVQAVEEPASKRGWRRR